MQNRSDASNPAADIFILQMSYVDGSVDETKLCLLTPYMEGKGNAVMT